MGLRLGNGISLISLLCWEVGYDQLSLNPFFFQKEVFIFLYVTS